MKTEDMYKKISFCPKTGEMVECKDGYEYFQKLFGIYVNVFPYWDWLRSEIKFAYSALSKEAGRGNYYIGCTYTDLTSRSECELLAFEYVSKTLADPLHTKRCQLEGLRKKIEFLEMESRKIINEMNKKP